MLRTLYATLNSSSSLIFLQEMDFTRMGKLALPSIAEPDDCFQAGSLEYYDKAYDRLVTVYPDTRDDNPTFFSTDPDPT